MTEASPRRLSPGGPGWIAVAPIVAVVAVGTGLALGWRGVDVAGSVHRVMQFRRDGFTAWDGSWYGGQWTLTYSVLFAPLAATLGLHLLALVDAAVSALAFERIVTRHAGSTARLAAVVFAAGIVVETSIGQLPFLSGEAVALAALWAADRRRWPVAWVLAATATLISPLAGAFVVLAAVAWLLASPTFPWSWPDRRHAQAVLGVAVGAALPLLVTTVLFPGQGQMPFPRTDCLWDLAIAAAIGALTPRHLRVLRTGTVLYAAALVAGFEIRSPLGLNIGRLGDCVALPLAVLLAWPRHRRVVVAVVVAVPLALSEWGPAWGAMTTLPAQPSARRAFYQPLDDWLTRADPGGRRGRVEVVPTEQHWESAWVADVEPLARGWERQSDVADNPIFYRRGALTAASYRAWLLDNGVAYIALAAAPLDYAAVAEGHLVGRGIPGLRPVWRSRNWRVWAVTGSTGLVAGGGAAVLAVDDQRVVLRADRMGALTVRVPAAGRWAVRNGDGCAAAAGRWTRLEVARPGVVVLAVTVGSSAGRCATPVTETGAQSVRPTSTSTPSARNDR